ncbi:MAG: twin-arginine translocase subunit TatC [Rhodospirillales bacterium]|nr:twin-arginine translocase subunit TatC [Rhodospirillales bacterium]
MTAMQDDDVDGYRMPLMEHLVELRRRLLYCVAGIVVLFFISYYFAPQIYGFLTQPLADAMGGRDGERRMIFTALHEAFFTYVKVALFTAMFVGFPLLATQLWMFVAPGLYKNERSAFLPFLIATPVFFVLGGAMAYYVVFPLAWRFFLGFEMPAGEGQLPIQLEAKVDQYLSLVMQLIFAFGLSFLMPVALTLLARVGIIDSMMMVDKRRYFIVAAFVIAAVITPPDVISQITLAVPLILLYELSLLAVRRIERARAKAAGAAPREEAAPAAARRGEAEGEDE